MNINIIEHGVVIPGRVSVMAMGVHYRFGNVLGVDMAHLNKYFQKKGPFSFLNFSSFFPSFFPSFLTFLDHY